MRRLGALVLAVAVLVAGCTGAPAAAPTARPSSGPSGLGQAAAPSVDSAPEGVESAPEAVADRCGRPGTPATTFWLTAPDGVALAAVEAGRGRRGVVLVHELGAAGLCGWWPYASYLAGRGFHVLLFDHRCVGRSACPSTADDRNGLMTDITAAVARLRSAGAARVVLLGGSQGAAEVVIAGTRPPAGVSGVAALSADELTEALAAPPYLGTAAEAAGKLRVPALFAVAADDRYVSVPETRALVTAAGRYARPLVELPADAGHGWELVEADSHGVRPPFNQTLVSFLTGMTG